MIGSKRRKEKNKPPCLARHYQNVSISYCCELSGFKTPSALLSSFAINNSPSHLSWKCPRGIVSRWVLKPWRAHPFKPVGHQNAANKQNLDCLRNAFLRRGLRNRKSRHVRNRTTLGLFFPHKLAVFPGRERRWCRAWGELALPGRLLHW